MPEALVIDQTQHELQRDEQGQILGHEGLPVDDIARLGVSSVKAATEHAVRAKAKLPAAQARLEDAGRQLRDLGKSEMGPGIELQEAKLQLEHAEALQAVGAPNRHELVAKGQKYDAREHLKQNRAAYEQAAVEDAARQGVATSFGNKPPENPAY